MFYRCLVYHGSKLLQMNHATQDVINHHGNKTVCPHRVQTGSSGQTCHPGLHPTGKKMMVKQTQKLSHRENQLSGPNHFSSGLAMICSSELVSRATIVVMKCTTGSTS